MTNTTAEILTVNGVVLNTYAKNIDTIAGRLRTPALRTANIMIPGKHGALRTPVKMFDQNQIALPMWVLGCDDNGGIPNGSSKRIEFFKRVDELTRLFKGSSSELDIRHTLPDSSVRQAFGDCMEVFDWTTTATPKGLFTPVITMSEPFWQDINPLSIRMSADQSVASVSPAALAGATAPMWDVQYTLEGPWLNPVLTFADGSYVAYDVSLSAGQTVKIDSTNWELTGTGGHNVDYTKIRHDGTDAAWAALPATSQTIVLGGTQRTGASFLTVAARRKFLVG